METREAAGLEDPADAGGGDAFAERGGHASGHKDILRHGSGPPGVFPMLSESAPGVELDRRSPRLDDARRWIDGVHRRRDEAPGRAPVRGGRRRARGHRADRPARPANAVGRVQPGPAADRRDRPGPSPRGRPDLRRGGVRGRLRAVDQRVRRPVHPVRQRGDLPPPLPGARQGPRGRLRDRLAGPLLVGRHRRDDADDHARGGRRGPRLRLRRTGRSRGSAPTSASRTSSSRSGSCRSAGRCRTSAHPA